MKSLAKIPYSNFALVLLNGAERGTTFRLTYGRMTIGRGSDNNITIKDDPKISRQHAALTVTEHGLEVSDISDRNKVIVNGDEVTARALSSGAVLQLGDTKFQVKQMVPVDTPAHLDLAPHESSQLYKDANSPAHQRRTAPSKRNYKKKSNTFYIIVGVVALVFVWLLTSSPKKKEISGLRTQEDIETTIINNNKLTESLVSEREKLGMNTRQYEEAQPNFVKGFRDYRKGQYDRAIESFQACLSLYAEHLQCQRYLMLSQKKFDELITYHKVLGNKYKAQSQYSACKAAYRNVMTMVKNTGSKDYQEAKSGYDACDLMSRERY